MTKISEGRFTGYRRAMRWRFLLAVLVLAIMAVSEEQAFEGCIESPEKGRCHELSFSACPDSWRRDNAIDDFFRLANDVVVGRRLTGEAQDCEGGRDVAVLAMTDVTVADRERLEKLAPSWLLVHVIETKFSETELNDFGDRAMAALDEAAFDSTGYHVELTGKVIVGVADGVLLAYNELEQVLPAGSFGVEEFVVTALNTDTDM